MGLTSSPVEVCNLSLDLLRHSQLMTNIDPPETEEEALGSRWYENTRRSVLRMFPWNFARRRASISRDNTAPAFEYSDAYKLPNDYIGIIFVGENPTYLIDTDYRVEGTRILINNDGAASLKISYVHDMRQVVRFDPIFLMLLVAELAVVFGNAITGLNKSIKGMEKLRDRWEVKARAKNGHENPPKIRHRSPLLESRRRARRSGQSDGLHLFPQCQ